MGEAIDYSMHAGDKLTWGAWGGGAVEVIDINWALGAAAIRLSPSATVVVPVAHLKKVQE